MATERAPYGHRREAQPATPYTGQSYYGRPVVKATHYGWPIVGYFFVGGLAGAAQLLAAVADVTDSRHRDVVRAGRYVALAGALTSPALLIVDLQTPGRWYNMLRIFRRTSAMSIGSWTLAMFGTLSGLTALAQAADDVLELPLSGAAARALGIPAAGAGVVMAIYTGSLIGTTSLPLWAAADDMLPALFGVSATATATATLQLINETLGGSRRSRRSLTKIAVVASGAEAALTLLVDRRWRRSELDAPLREAPRGPAYRWGVLGLGIGAPLVVHAAQLVTGKHARPAAIAAAVATLLGGLIQRAVLVFAGNASAHRPEDYLRYTQLPTPDDPPGRRRAVEL